MEAKALGTLYFAYQFSKQHLKVDALMCACNRSHSDIQLSELYCWVYAPELASYYRSDVLQHHGSVYSSVVVPELGGGGIQFAAVWSNLSPAGW